MDADTKVDPVVQPVQLRMNESLNATSTSASVVARDVTKDLYPRDVLLTADFQQGLHNASPSTSLPFPESETDSPSTIYLDPGCSIIANSVVMVKSDYGFSQPKTYTYNFSFVNNTPEPIKLDYQPILKQSHPCHQQHIAEPLQSYVEPIPAAPFYTSSPGLQRQPYVPEEAFPPSESTSCDRTKEIKIKTEPVDYSITMNEAYMDTETDVDSLQDDLEENATTDQSSAEAQEIADSVEEGPEKDTLHSPQAQSVGRKSLCKKVSSPKKKAGTPKKRTSSQVSRQPQEMQSDASRNTAQTMSPQTSKITREIENVREVKWPSPAESESQSRESSNFSVETVTMGKRGCCTDGDQTVDETSIPGTSARPSSLIMKEITYSCDVCGDVLANKKLFKKHAQTHSNASNFTCEYCGKTFKYRAALKKHIDKHISGGQGKNDTSSQVETNPPSNELILCDCCGKSFKKLYSLRRHAVVHSDQRRFKCSHCEKYFKTREYLKRHTRTHTKEKRYVCEVCAKAFTEVGSLTCHRRIHTGETPYSCKYCGDRFRQQAALNHHVNSRHTCEKIYSCDMCEKVFSTSISLNRHRQLHELRTNERPYQCETCVKAYRSKGALAVHVRTHTGEKPYKCRYCERTFNRSNQRAVHQRLHTGEKPYKCRQCGKTFRQRKTWAEHLNVHTGERPFKCRFCDKKFGSKATVYNHEKMHKREAAKLAV